MTAIEHVEKLKADRRAVLAAELEKAERDRAAERAKADTAWERDMRLALADLGCEWLILFRANKDEGTWRHNCFTIRDVVFHVPGHRPIALRMHEVNHYDPQWQHAGSLVNVATWSATIPNGKQDRDTLADALIAAEMEPGEADREPIPF